ncbi:AMP-binding protein [Nocardia australiensis]|uniref:AMP-binding protein n=1 Tax=Nocardia australiensis TaxID=2887191 RepID=UPI0027DF6922|nr:AMP-binding protein [Nocardia australiensis]
MTEMLATRSTTALVPRDLFADRISRFGGRTAVVSQSGTLSYRDLSDAASRVAVGLSRLGVVAGTPVAIILPNCVEYLVASLAIYRLGAVKVPVNPGLKTAEVNFILTDSDAEVAITDDQHPDVATGGSLRHVVAVRSVEPEATAWTTLFEDPSGTSPPCHAIDPSAPGVIFYTGGTTGRPKGVVHTQQSLATNLLAQLLETALQDDERMLLSTPLAHAAGAMAEIGLLKGATLYIESGFNVSRTLDLLSNERITFTFMVPTMIYALLDAAQGLATSDFALRTLLYGAAPIDPARLQQGIDLWGPVFMQLYGQTEAPNFITRLTREDHSNGELLRSTGRATALMDVAILDEDGQSLPSGRPGEVCTRGPYVMSGYHKLPQQTLEVLYDGWLHTGDIGYLNNDGYLFLLDRKKDMIISGGMNVYSAEVEDALRDCPGVARVAVIGIPDPYWGEAVTAVVVADNTENSPFDTRIAAERCNDTLAGYKRPKRYVEVRELPLTSLGKIDKAALKKKITDGDRPSRPPVADHNNSTPH